MRLLSCSYAPTAMGLPTSYIPHYIPGEVSHVYIRMAIFKGHFSYTESFLLKLEPNVW